MLEHMIGLPDFAVKHLACLLSIPILSFVPNKRRRFFRNSHKLIDMTKQTFIALLAAILTLLPGETSAKEKIVNYTEVRNYFHINGTTLPFNQLITTQADLDKYFSPAAVMGKNGEPTKVDFRKQIVMAILLAETDRTAEIKDLKIVDTGKSEYSGKNELHLKYTVNYGPRQSYVVEPMYLVAINAKYRDYTVYDEGVVTQADESSSSDFRNVHYVGYNSHIDLSIDYPTSQGNLRNAVLDYESALLKGASDFFCPQDGPSTPGYSGEKGDADKMFNYYIGQLTTNMKGLDKANDMPYRPCSMQYKILRTDETDRYLTLEANGYGYTGGAHGQGLNKGVTFNKATGKKAELVQKTVELQKLITSRLPKDLVDGYTQDKPVPFPANDIFFKNGTIVFLYESDEIACHAAGQIMVTFYPAEIQNYLTEEGKILTEMN